MHDQKNIKLALIYSITAILKISYLSKLNSLKLNKFYAVYYLPQYNNFALHSDKEYSRF